MGTECTDNLFQAVGKDAEDGPKFSDILKSQTWATMDAQSSRKQPAQAALLREMNRSGDWTLASNAWRAGFVPEQQ
eukprot:5056123-Prorocentrum_lima.AAC.1